jgi:hypothetical protein
MPRGSKPGERRGGRVAGTKNRATIQAGLLATRQVDEARANGAKLGTEILSEFANLFRTLALEAHEDQDMRGFARWSRYAVDAAKAIAPFQSPSFKPIEAPAPPPDPREIEEEGRARITLRIFENNRLVEEHGPDLIDGHDQFDVVDGCGDAAGALPTELRAREIKYPSSS